MAETTLTWLRHFTQARAWAPEIALFAVALVLSLAALPGEPLPLDTPLSQAIQAWQFPLLDPVMHGVSAIGWFRIAAPITVAVIVFLAILGLRAQAVIFGVSALCGHLLNQLLKVLIERPRPEMAAEEMASLGVDSFAFPSGHAQSSTIFYGFLIYILWRHVQTPWLRWLGIAAGVTMIILVGLSRMYLGVHWPSDIVGAYSIGVLWILLWTRALHAWLAIR
jgi:undecaprenyl-diphosphatase